MTKEPTWQPWLADDTAPLYRRLALALRQDVASGRLAAGARLPTHRELAQALGTTVVTASRAYREAAAWGLVEATVGRGTFVASPGQAPPVAGGPNSGSGMRSASGAGDGNAGGVEGTGGLGGVENTGRTDGTGGAARGAGRAGDSHGDDTGAAGARTELVELTANYVAVSPDELNASGAARGLRLLWDGLTRRYPPGGSAAHRLAAAAWLERDGWAPRAAEIVATSGAQHAILVALAALAPPGGTVYAEALTYHGIKPAARTLGLRLIPVAIDEHGLIPAALAAQCAGRPGGLLFCQPSLHNPTSSLMPLERRQDIARLARRHDLILLEDCVYEFLLAASPPPLAALAPERTCHIVSAAKAFVQGLRTGYLAAPEPWVPRLQAEVAATTLAAPPGLLDLAAAWMTDGTAARLVLAKRREAARRQELAARRLGAIAGLVPRTHPGSSHLWLELPPPWTTAGFVEQARRRGVAVNPATAFAVEPALAPAAVRVCLGPLADPHRLDDALARLASLLAGAPPPEDPIV